MIGIFSRTTELYDALANETRLSILILLRAKKEIDLKNLGYFLMEESVETLENHLNILKKVKLIQKSNSNYLLTNEGKRRLTELGVTESEAMELAEERETLLRSTSQNEVRSTIIATGNVGKTALLKDIKAVQLENIGLVYKNKGQLDEALRYFQGALNIYRKIGHKQGEATQLEYIGLVYKNKGQLDEALRYFQGALNIYRKIGHKQGEATQLENIGFIHENKEKTYDE